jgi:hypothetical protein
MLRTAVLSKSQIGLLPPPTCAKLLCVMNVTPPPDGTAPGLAALVLALLIVALIALDFLPGGMDSITVQLQPFDRRIAAQPGDFSLVFVPTPKAYERFSHTLETFLSDTSLNGMRHLGLRYLMLQGAYYYRQEHTALATIEAALVACPRMEEVTEVDQFIIYEFQR